MAIHISSKKTRTTTSPRLTTLRRRIVLEIACPPDDLREWDTRWCHACQHDSLNQPDCAATGLPHLPPLYYALAPELPDGDMPLGMGASPRAALTDLLWHIRARHLLDDLQAL